uniref:Uncharacterized protein n=1 Tax=Candidatus Methanogaster sp. ANME-2c ERB4 TaxID=2759911 RepID=A0A7G9Y6X4_9EURY|nr:hypothetical protein ALLGJMBF_00010 [Methanosarcinales archaeon ANME-2c ERB4]
MNLSRHARVLCGIFFAIIRVHPEKIKKSLHLLARYVYVSAAACRIMSAPEGCDAAVAVHVCRGIPAAGGCEPECDRGVGGGEDAIGVEVA